MPWQKETKPNQPNFYLLHNSQWITLPFQSHLLLYSFCDSLLHSFIIWLTLSYRLLHLLLLSLLSHRNFFDNRLMLNESKFIYCADTFLVYFCRLIYDIFLFSPFSLFFFFTFFIISKIIFIHLWVFLFPPSHLTLSSFNRPLFIQFLSTLRFHFSI